MSHLITIGDILAQTRMDVVYVQQTAQQHQHSIKLSRVLHPLHHPRLPSLPSTDPSPCLPSRLIETLRPV